MKYQLINPINQNYSTIEQILTNRGISKNNIYHYLNTTDDDINSFTNKKDCLVIIDSDADGFTSSAILINYLHDLFPAWVETNLDYRVHDGKQHGLNDHIDWIIKSQKYSLVIVPDAGSNDAEECTRLKENNINTIVLDHHLCDIDNPDAIVINNQLSNYPNKDFSGAGVVWQFCRYLDSLLQKDNANNYLDLMALGLNLYRG